ncbi:hypothetical protein M407DRAFT_20503 [Tulasnella calospora MUT 4182]|uniref:Uncharacterized protein n=1 Tax=Tulasnella calospora MUT 4182 TaxID=1051891 RepID=A0A0C3L9C6_9AGAM|nr:hypothetical protein M407DRAFT_20503 [Tulasnella calospora MUT 4182]
MADLSVHPWGQPFRRRDIVTLIFTIMGWILRGFFEKIVCVVWYTRFGVRIEDLSSLHPGWPQPL